jgi:hypothetical protein
MMNPLTDLSPAVQLAIAALIVVQLTLQISALVSLVRTPAERISLGGRKWVWALVIILGEVIGPIVYFAAGRLPAAAEEHAASAPVADRARHAADTLYGAPDTASGDSIDAGDSVASDPAQGVDGTGMGELP